MKRVTQRIFLAVCAVLLAAIAYFLSGSRDTLPPEARDSSSLKKTVATSALASTEIGSYGGSVAKIRNKIPPASGETLLDVYAFNLDLDEEDEQIMVVKRADDPEGKIRVVLADYVPERRDWIRSWEGETSATQIKTFIVMAEDLIGDRNQTLVCLGMNQANQQVLNVFWRDSGADSEGLRFVSVLDISADSVEIEKLDRTEGYELGLSNGVSWPIIAYADDPDASNPLDQLMIRYEWSFRSQRYEKTSVETIPGATIESRKAASILTGDTGTFEEFLDGMWYREATGPDHPDARLLIFDRKAKTIVFYWQKRQEVFSWDSSSPKRLGLYATVRNQTVPSVRRFMTIELLGVDRVSMRIAQEIRIRAEVDHPWDGTYRKLDTSFGSSVPAPEKNLYREASLTLEGEWKSGTDDRWRFEGRSCRIVSGGTERGGLFSLFDFAGKTYLQVVESRPGSPVQTKRDFLVVVERDSKGAIVKLSLHPVLFGISGAIRLEDDSVVLTRALEG